VAGNTPQMTEKKLSKHESVDVNELRALLTLPVHTREEEEKTISYPFHFMANLLRHNIGYTPPLWCGCTKPILIH